MIPEVEFSPFHDDQNDDRQSQETDLQNQHSTITTEKTNETQQEVMLLPETLELIIFYAVKFTCIGCLVTTWAIFCAGCINTSLQIIFTFENGYENSENIWMYRAFQGMFLPNIFILWAVICAYIMSRQSELIYLVYLTPYYSYGHMENAGNAVGVLHIDISIVL